jgi:transcriptional regulator with XRE-family HTH domain
MPKNEEFRQLVRSAVGKLSQREIADKTGISQPYAYQILNGHIPSREKLVALVDGLDIKGWQRARLFDLANYRDDQDAPGDELPVPFQEVAREMQRQNLSVEQLKMVRRLIEQPGRLDALRALIDSNDRVGAVALAA